MNSREYSEGFEKIYKLFTEAYLVFYVWKGLEDKSFEKTYSRNVAFWNATLLSLENCWLTQLARIYENSKYSDDATVISVYALLPHHTDEERTKNVQNILSENKEIVDNIQRLRHNQLAHNNAKHLQEPSKILTKFPVKYTDVERLLKLTGEILSNLNPKPGHAYAYEMLAENSERDGKSVVEKLEYYEKLHKKHLDRFVGGEIDDPIFPTKETNNQE